MTDAERLADWLHHVTPEPPNLLTAERVLATAPTEARGIPSRRPRITPILLAAAAIVAIVALAVGVTTLVGRHRGVPPVSPITPSPKVSSGVSGPPKDFASLRVIGSHGLVEWRLTQTLSVTLDGGRYWTPVPLPAQVTPASLGVIDVSTNGTVLLGVVRDETVELYRRVSVSDAWTRSTLVPTKPASLNVGRQAPTVYAIDQRNGILSVVAGWGLTTTGAFADLFVASNGTTFTQYPTNIGLAVHDVLFLDRDHGLLVAGPNQNVLYRTQDGGRTWTAPSAGPARFYGQPTGAGSTVEIPITTTGSDGGSVISILRSSNFGAFFTRTPHPLHIPVALVAGDISVAVEGSNIWAPARGRIYESRDGGNTWTAVPTAQTVDDITLIGSSRGVGQSSADCSSSTDGCYITSYLVATDDGGRTWRTQ